jgi:hypothetical protein
MRPILVPLFMIGFSIIAASQEDRPPTQKEMLAEKQNIPQDN